MDFAGIAVVSVGPRAGAEVAEWPAVLRVDRVDDDTFTETELRPVTSYEDAQARLTEASADRLFIPADVLADMVAAGAGPRA
jgi:hypothetical protein